MAATPSATPKPGVVVAVIDTGINPYHSFFYAGSRIYPNGGAPAAVTLPLLKEFGIDARPDCWIKLTRTGKPDADYAADVAAGKWTAAAACNVVWFVDTNILARSFVAGTRAYLPDDDEDTHGVGVSAAVLTANPDAVVLFLEGAATLSPGNSASKPAEDYAFDHPAVDFVNTSYGAPGSVPLVFGIESSYEGTYSRGKLHFGACDNSPSTGVQDGTCGPWWSIGLAGFEETQANEASTSSGGRQLISGSVPDFISDFTQTLPYCAICQSGEESTGGTSFATPRSAGTASRVLLLARRALAQNNGIYVGSGGTLMAAGHIGKKAVAFSNWQLRRALELAAWVPEFGDYDPFAGAFEPAYPIPPEAPWLALGWGVLSPDPKAGVIERSLVALGVTTGELPTKDIGFCEFQNSLIAIRKTYWDSVEPFSPTFANPPSPDPYIYCDSFAALAADVPEKPQDSDGDGDDDAKDNCPTVANASQSDGDGDGQGDSCDSTSSSADSDGDGVPDDNDNCPMVANPTQQDSDGNGNGDACNSSNPPADGDGDGVADTSDNCPSTSNANQADADMDGIGDACDSTPTKELSCSAAFSNLPTGANVAAVDPQLQYNKPGHLILTFADARGRDEATRRLKSGKWLPAKVASQVYGFRHLRSVRIPLPMVTPEIVQTLRKASQGLSLISIWGEHPRKPLIDTSVPLIGVDAAREAFATASLPLTGKGIGVAIIDTGVDASHGDLKAVKHNVRMVGNEAVSYDDAPINNTEVNNGHGTHIAGTIAGDGARSGGRYVGVAPEADVVGIAVDVAAPYLFVLEAMDYVLQQQDAYNIRVTNHSYGPATGSGFRFDPADPDAQAIKALHDAGIIPVFAAGNSGPDADTISADAQNPCALGVAAGDRKFQLADFSSRGTQDGAAIGPDITAPGVDITASRAINGLLATGFPSGNNPPYYSTISGTSMAAPHVVAVIALMLEAKPELSFAQVRNILTSTATPMKRADGKAYAAWEVGAGYIDALGAIAKTLGKPKPNAADAIQPGPGITEVGKHEDSSGTLTTPVVCAGCNSDPEFRYSRYTYKLPVKVTKLTGTLSWPSPAEIRSLEIMGPDGKSKAFAGFDPSGARGAPTPGATQIVASVNDAVPGTYTFLVQESLAAGGLPVTLTITTECPAAGCTVATSTPTPSATAIATATPNPSATPLPTATPTSTPTPNSTPSSTDDDGDGVSNSTDNCPTRSNPGQEDVDGDGAGNACDTVNNNDPDGDGVASAQDNCPTTSNANQNDSDGDGAGDACDSVNNADPDGDGVANAQDNCPNTGNADQADANGNGIGDACDTTAGTDADGDGVVNGNDNCPNAPNPSQADADGDGAGNVCDSVNNSDNDGDGVANSGDNCPAAPNPNQADADGDGAGDVCDNVNHVDQDGDGVQAGQDNCPNNANPNQADGDGDGIGNVCDGVNDLDDDGDGVEDQADNCPAVPNQGQADGDGDGVGDNCDASFNDDVDGDGIVNGSDNCPSVPNANQRNQDGDRYGDACDADQGNGGGTARINRASAGPIVADAGNAVRLGDVELRNTSPFAHRVHSIELKLSNPSNVARIYGTVQGVRFHCAPAQPAVLNTCVADAVLELQPGQVLKVDVWVELKSAAAKLQQLSALELTMGGGGLMLIGTVGLGVGRRRQLGCAALVAAALLLGACGGKDQANVTGEGADPKLSTVALEGIEMRDSLNAPVDYGVPSSNREVGQVGAN